MRRQFKSPIVLLGARLLSPYIMLFGLYVIFHGHYSPGGGFQGGTLLAASVILIRLAGGKDIAELQISEFSTTPMAAIGVLIITCPCARCASPDIIRLFIASAFIGKLAMLECAFA